MMVSCAKTGKLYGGPEDKVPPKIDKQKSTPNYQTNFIDRQIVLHFDEFVEIKSIDKEVLISPPMENNPKITQRGKKIMVNFHKDEVLREDATYSIQFGKSIRDFTEGNVLENYKFVFATGDQLDSLKYSGSVVDAYTGEAIEGALIMLYDDLTDSIVRHQRPFYLMKTDKEGKFNLENLRQDTFKVVAIKDLNVNYKYDLEAEGIGYMDSTIVLTDSLNDRPKISLFFAEQPLTLATKNFKSFGKLTHIYSKAVDSSLIVNMLTDHDLQFVREEVGDTLQLWYTESVDSFKYRIGMDTFKVYPRLRDSIFDDHKVVVSPQAKSFPSWQQVLMNVSAPIASIDTSKLQIFEYITPVQVISEDSIAVDSAALVEPDTTVQFADTFVLDSILNVPTQDNMLDSISIVESDTLSYSGDSLNQTKTNLVFHDTLYQPVTYSFDKRELQLHSIWKENQKYTMLLMPGAVEDIYGRKNDTLKVDFTIAKDTDYGDIILAFTGLKDSLGYVVELLQGDKLVKKRLLTAPVDSMVFEKMKIGEYQVRIVQDSNGDGLWTTGSYWDHRQPELINRYSLEKMQPGFDLQAQIRWGDPMKLAKEEENDDEPSIENNNSATDRFKKPKSVDE